MSTKISLSRYLVEQQRDALALLNAAEITETKRAEEVDVAGFVRLAKIAEKMGH